MSVVSHSVFIDELDKSANEYWLPFTTFCNLWPHISDANVSIYASKWLCILPASYFKNKQNG